MSYGDSGYNNNNNNNNNNNRNSIRTSGYGDPLNKIYAKYRGDRISSSGLNKLDRYLESLGVSNKIYNRIQVIKNEIDDEKVLHSNQVKKIKQILKNNIPNNNDSVNNENNSDLNSVLSDELDTQTSMCLHKTKSECTDKHCLYQDKRCVPNVLSNQKMCHGKSFHECIAPCKFYGKNVHEKDACHYKYISVEEAKEEHSLIAKELKELKKYIDVLQHKNKSIVYNISNEIKTIDEKLIKLYNDREKILKKQRKSTNTFGDYTNRLSKINEKIFKLKNDREEMKSILSSIKFIKDIQDKTLKKTKRGARVYGVKSRRSKRKRY
jgi:hypothetical protein